MHLIPKSSGIKNDFDAFATKDLVVDEMKAYRKGKISPVSVF